jgi:hypothetical protein
MDKSPVSIAQQLQRLRLNVLPAYCYDGDEAEKTPEDYVGFYSQTGPKALEDVEQYIRAFRRFCADTSSEQAFSELQVARHAFVLSSPYCFDELDNIDPPDRARYIDTLRSIYRSDCTTGFVIERLDEYRSFIRDLLAALDKTTDTTPH